MRRLVLPWVSVHANDTTGFFLPATGWMSTADFDKVRATFELQGRINQLDVQMAYQTANVESSPDAAVVFGVARSSNGIEYPSAYTATATNTDGKKLVRFGYWCKTTTGSAISLGQVAAVVELVPR